MRFLLVTMRSLLVNVNFDLPHTTREPLGLTVRFLMVTMRESLGLTVRFLMVTMRFLLVSL